MLDFKILKIRKDFSEIPAIKSIDNSIKGKKKKKPHIKINITNFKEDGKSQEDLDEENQ